MLQIGKRRGGLLNPLMASNQQMEMSSLLHGEREVEEQSCKPHFGPSARLAVAAVTCFTAGVVAWRSSSSTSLMSTGSPTGEAAALYSKKDVYGPDYGKLVGGYGSAMQKAWPGLTCARSDDDKWGWGSEPMSQPLDSGTNCVEGDSWFCSLHYKKNPTTGFMTEVSQLMWNRCNSSCNATDEGLLANEGNNATLVGSSGLAACQFEGVMDMQEVCTGLPTAFVDFTRRRYLKAVAEIPEKRRQLREQRRLSNVAPSVPDRWMADILINQTYSNEACNTHGLCGTCYNETTNEFDTYCEAFLLYYGGTAATWKNGYSASLFWYNDDLCHVLVGSILLHS